MQEVVVQTRNEVGSNSPHKPRFLRLEEVKNRTGLSRSSIYLYINGGEFPRSVNLGIRSVGWLESEIEEWIAARVHRSRL